MKYLSHVDKYLTLKYKYKYKYFEMVLEYYSSTSTSTKYYISAINPKLEPRKRSRSDDALLSYGHLTFSTLWPENGHRTPETGDRMWFYILSNATMQCIGQTIIKNETINVYNNVIIRQEARLLLRNSRSYASHHRDNNTLPSAMNDFRNSQQRKHNGRVINKAQYNK